MALQFDYNSQDNSIKLNTLGTLYGSSLEDFDVVMAAAIDKIVEVKKVSRIILSETREYEYDWEQTRLLVEIANALDEMVRGRRLMSVSNLSPRGCDRHTQERSHNVQRIVVDLMRRDPIGAYAEVLREIRKAKIDANKNLHHTQCYAHYVNNSLLPMQRILEATALIQMVKDNIAGYHVGDRTLYREIFHPTIRPNFMLTRFMSATPKGGQAVDKYLVGDIVVEIYKIPSKSEFVYHVIPPEFQLSEDKYMLLDAARRYMAAHKPVETEFSDPERAREIFYNIGRDMIRDLSTNMGIFLGPQETEDMTKILTRYTAGFGVLEILLLDEKIQDIYINSPIGQNPIFINHSDYNECVTNLIPTKDDAESWATRFRIASGRPLDEANPVLDTDIIVPGGRARVAAITKTLSPEGLAFAFRRHRDKPWTLPLFIKSGMIDPLFAGVMSFLIDGSASMLIAGGRGSGKTSLLNALMLEISPNKRILTVEDTIELSVDYMRKLGYNIERLKSRSVITHVETEMAADEAIRTALRLGDSSLIIGEVRSSIRGNEEVFIVENGRSKRIKIEDLEGKPTGNILVPTIGPDLKLGLSKLSGFVKHPKRSKLLKIKTKTGREVTITHDHSLFTANDFRIAPIECKDLKAGDKIVIPSAMPYGYNDMDHIDVAEMLPELRVSNAEDQIRHAIKVIGWRKASEVCNTRDIYRYLLTTQKTNLPINSFTFLMDSANIEPDIGKIKIKTGTSNTIPARLPVNNDFCRLLGYIVSEGWVSDSSVSISNNYDGIVNDVISLSNGLFGIDPYVRETHGWGVSRQIKIQSVPLAKLIHKLGCGKGAENKRIPPFVFGLSQEKICAFLRGLYSGDGSFTVSKQSGNAVRYHTTSKKLAEDVMYMLLCLGIVARIRQQIKPIPENPIYTVEFKKLEEVQKFLSMVGFVNKDKKLHTKPFSHSKFNSVNFDPKELEKHLKLIRKYRHLRRSKKCSLDYLRKVVEDPETNADDLLKTFVNGNFFLDEVKEIEEITLEEPEYVYDLSVDPTQNFVGGFGGILLHNTEAKALYEAMRIGALSNVVAGTIHGESPYGVYDRVVNDLGVPSTSFKATDIIVISKMLRSADGLRKFRRVTELTEVRKHWKNDPFDEKGFVNLMEYSAAGDSLKSTEILSTGESEIINRIASLTREWEGRWEDVWENIQLRTNIKKAMVDYSTRLNLPDILEAPWVTSSNEYFHIMSAKLKEETGYLDSKEIFARWEKWFGARVKDYLPKVAARAK